MIYQQHFARYGWKADAPDLKKSFRKTFAELADPDFLMESAKQSFVRLRHILDTIDGILLATKGM